MNLKQFAKLAGFTVQKCGPGWGGDYGYTTIDAPNCITCGFKTVSDARTHWITNEFGEIAGAAILELLET